jgi:hypothetical protein
MAATSTRTITIALSGDVTATEILEAAENTVSPASVEIKTLASGANTITAPTGGSTVRAVTIVPPAGNTASITFKGVTGDTGVALHLTDPSSIGLGAGVTAFCLTAGATITGIRLYWS